MPEPPSRDLIDTDFSEKLPPNLSKIEELIDKYGTQVRKLQNDLPIMDGNIINYDELTEEQKKAFKDNLEAAIDIGFELRKTALSQTMTPEELAAEQKMKEVTKDNFKNHFDTMVRSVDADTMCYLLTRDFDALGLIKETSKEFYGNTKVSDYFDKYKNEKVVIQDDVLSTAYRQNPGASNIMMRKNDFITMIQTNKLEELLDLAINEKTIHPVKGSDFINARKDGGRLFKQQWQKDHPVDKAPVFSSESELEMKGVKFKLVQDSDLNQLKNDVVKKEKDERAFIEKNQERINKEQNDKDMVNDVMANDMFLNNL